MSNRRYNPRRNIPSQNQENDVDVHQEETVVAPVEQEQTQVNEKEDIVEQLKRVVSSSDPVLVFDEEPTTSYSNVFGTPVNLKQPNIENIAKQIENEVQKSKTMYTVKKENGKVVFETEKPNTQDVSTVKDHSRKSLVIEQMIKDIDNEILKAEIEIEVHRILEQDSKSEQEMNMNLSRINSFHTNIAYLKKKKDALNKLR